MKNNKISLLALLVSVISLAIVLFRVEIYTTNDTFVGIMAAFIGICATFMVGHQIINSIELNRKISDINSTQIELKEELEKEKEERQKSNLQMRAYYLRVGGISASMEQPFQAYFCFIEELKLFLDLKNIGEIKTTSANISNLVRRTTKMEVFGTKYIEDIESFSFYELEKYELFSLIKNDYIDAHEKMKKIAEKYSEAKVQP